MASRTVSLVLKHDRTTSNYERYATAEDPRDKKFKDDKPFIAQIHVPLADAKDLPKQLTLDLDLETGKATLRAA